MNNVKEKNINVFQDTKRLSETNNCLINAIRESTARQYIVKETDNIETMKGHRYNRPAKILVSKKRSLEAASYHIGQKVCVHNFASATNPGGAVTKGSNAQEESICRCSTLYFNISEHRIVNEFHKLHRDMLKKGEMDAKYNDDCIYTPGVKVFKSDTSFPKLLPEESWYEVDVITCAAPNLRKDPSNAMNPNSGDKQIIMTDSQLRDLHIKRMRRILDIAKMEEVEVMILGAFGCGAFANSPQVVAEAMKMILKEYRYDFKVIEFAVFCTKKDMQNYEIFKSTIS